MTSRMRVKMDLCDLDTGGAYVAGHALNAGRFRVPQRRPRPWLARPTSARLPATPARVTIRVWPSFGSSLRSSWSASFINASQAAPGSCQLINVGGHRLHAILSRPGESHRDAGIRHCGVVTTIQPLRAAARAARPRPPDVLEVGPALSVDGAWLTSRASGISADRPRP